VPPLRRLPLFGQRSSGAPLALGFLGHALALALPFFSGPLAFQLLLFTQSRLRAACGSLLAHVVAHRRELSSDFDSSAA